MTIRPMAHGDDHRDLGHFDRLGRMAGASIGNTLRRMRFTLALLLVAFASLAVVGAVITSLRLTERDGNPAPVLFQVLASVGVAVAGAYVGRIIQNKLALVGSQTDKGLLATAPTIRVLSACNPFRFSEDELGLRKKAIKQIGRLAATIESIPSSIQDPEVTRAAFERGQAMRALQARVAFMDSMEEQRSIVRDLASAKELYDSGRWKDLPAAEVVDPPSPSLLSRATLTLIAFVCFTGIVAVLILTAMSMLPPTAVPITFALGLILVPTLNRLGISGDSMKQAVEVVSKAQGGITGKTDEKKVNEGAEIS